VQLFPSQNYTINTALTPKEVAKKLKQVVGPKQSLKALLKSKKKDKLFEGEITDNSFTISRIIFYQNSFKPLIKGSYTGNANGTQIDITMGLPKMVIVLITIWCVFDFALILLGAVDAFFNGRFNVFLITGLLSLVLPFAGIKMGYPKEAVEAQNTLAQLFQ
jgi:hypothetical protein